ACAPPPHPHSCPTRRSSDLSAACSTAAAPVPSRRRAAVISVKRAEGWVIRCRESITRPCSTLQSAEPDALDDAAVGDEEHHEERDRKSTRLNSSHGSISYAV